MCPFDLQSVRQSDRVLGQVLDGEWIFCWKPPKFTKTVNQQEYPRKSTAVPYFEVPALGRQLDLLLWFEG